jgi:hypothetical protein
MGTIHCNSAVNLGYDYVRKWPGPRHVCDFSLMPKLIAINFTIQPLYPSTQNFSFLWTKLYSGNPDLITALWKPCWLEFHGIQAECLLRTYFPRKHMYSVGKTFLGTIEIVPAVIRVTWEYDEMQRYPACPRDRVLRRWQSGHLPTP